MFSCPECHRILATDAVADGLCPRCLLQLGLGLVPAAALGDGPDTGPDARPTGEWQVLTLLGSGPHGTTYLGEKRGPQPRVVALKVLDLVDSAVAAGERLRQALPSLVALDHAALAPVLGGGLTAGGIPYLVSAYVPGASLAHPGVRLPQSLDDRLRMAMDLADAVACLHAHGLAHGHLVSANVIVSRHRPPRVFLTDPGIAALAGRPVTLAADVAALVDLVGHLLPERPGAAAGTTSAGEVAMRLAAGANSA